MFWVCESNRSEYVFIFFSVITHNILAALAKRDKEKRFFHYAQILQVQNHF
jgi:hypothetical protein